jgi:hypothetical protein
VENLWTSGANPVEKPTVELFFGARFRLNGPASRLWMTPSRSPSLDCRTAARKIVRAPHIPLSIGTNVTHHVHRFSQTIAGRDYEIEVMPVSNRWRAQLRRIPGVPTAMMPFYGPTPDEAARQLTRWLSLAHQRLSTSKPPA